MEWSAEQEEAAQKKVQENCQPLPAEKQGIKHFIGHPPNVYNALIIKIQFKDAKIQLNLIYELAFSFSLYFWFSL